jgi:hypothetical protein
VASGHPLVRRSSFAIAAALTSVALTTTAAVSLTGNDGSAVGSPGSAAAAERAAQTGPVVVGSAIVTDPALRSASEKATAVLSDADYVTREGDLDRKERKQLRAAARNLRSMLEQASDSSGTGVAGARQAAAASRDGERTSLAERATDASAGKADASPSPAATEPTNLAGTVTGVAPLAEQGTAGRPVLETPLAASVDLATRPQQADAGTGAGKSADPAAPSATRIEKETASLQRLITKADGDAVVSVKAGPTPEEIAAAKKASEERREARAARAAEREAAKARAAAAARVAEAKEMAKAAQGYGNGQIPSSVLCDLGWAPDQLLRCDAAVELEDLNDAFRAEFGRNLDVTDGYRSYAEQLSVAASKGGLAAVPGTSNHGWGQAVDLSGGIESFGTAEHAWMVANAGEYGWKHPAWAQAGGSKPEAWHWEYGTSY